MKKSFTSLKMFFGVFIAVLAFGYNTANASSVTINITAPAAGTTVIAGSTFIITAHATTTCGGFFGGMDHVNFNGNGSNANDYSGPSGNYSSGNITAPTTPGSYTYTVTGYDNCGNSPSKTITITVIPATPPAAPTGIAGSNCGTGTVTLSASGGSPAGGTYNWYAASSGGAALQSSTSSSYTTIGISATTTYYVSYTSGSLESSRTAVIATIYPLPDATFTPANTTYINTSTTITLTTAIPPGTTAIWSLVDGSIISTTGTNVQATWPTVGVKPLTLTLTNANGCSTSFTATITVTQNINNGNYAFSQPISLNTTAITGGLSSSLSNFPALVSIQENALITSGALVQNCANNVYYPTDDGVNGYDFAFTINGNTNELFYQVESYDPTTGTLLVWVQIPLLTSATNTSLTFYFGSKTPNHPPSFTKSTWTNDYEGVYHFSETPGAGSTTADATIYNNTGTTSGMVAGNLTAGQIGKAYTYNGTTTKVSVNGGINIPGPFTLSAWVKVSSEPHDQKIMTNQTSSIGGYKLGVYSNNIPESETVGLVNRGLGTIAPTIGTGSWHYLQSVFSGTTLSTYEDGVQYQVVNTTNNSSSNNPFLIGTGEGGSTLWFYGAIDEVRVSSVAKTTDWIKAEYYNQTNPATFTICGSTITGVLANSQPIGGAIVYTWKGGGTTNPLTASNWTSSAVGTPTGVPPFDGTCSLNISGGATPYPVLTSNISVYGLTMGAGAIINLGNYTLNVGCHIYNNSAGTGSITSSSLGIVNFNGLLATQNYYCSSTNTNTLANLTLNNSTGGTLDITGSGNVSVSNLLTVTKGNIVVDPTGSLLLTSTSAGTANVAIIPSPYTISGNVSVQRYITGGAAGYRGYRILSSPVNINGLTSQTGSIGYIGLDYLNTGMLTGGPGSGFDVVTTNPLTYFYNEARTKNLSAYIAGKNVGVYGITGSGGSPAYSITTYGTNLASTTAGVRVPVGNSYEVFFVGNLSNTTSSPIPNAATVTAVGCLNQGTIPVNIFNGVASSLFMSYTLGTGAVTPGFNQMGNPYASTISADQVYTDNTGAITPIFWELKEPGNIFVAYDASSHTASVAGSGAGAYIASGQGFFVVANGTGKSLTFKETEKVTTQLTAVSTPPLLLDQRLKNTNSIAAAETLPSGLAGLHLQIARDTATYTQTGIYFDKTWSDKFSPMEDAVDLDGTAPKVFLSSYSVDGARLCINQLGDYSKGKTIKLYASATASGTYTISLADIQNIDPLYNAYLRDHKLNDSVDLRTTNSYNFNLVIGDTTTYGANRFDLVIEQKALPPYQLLSFAGQKVNTGVQLNWKVNNAGNYTGFILEKQVSNNNYTPIYTIQSNSSTTYSFVDQNPIVGSNTYRLAQNDINGNVTYSSLVTIGYNNVSSNGYFSVYPNPSKDVINILVNSTTATSPNYTADIYNTSGVLIDHRVLNTFTWTEDISSYKEGVYIIALKNTNGDVMAKSKFIKTK